jgi:hypothetical protein
LAARAGRIKAACSDLSGRKFILDIGKAFSLENLRRGHEALLKIQVHGLHFKISIPLHNAISGPAALLKEAHSGGHSPSHSKRDRGGWYTYNRKNSSLSAG